MKDDTHNVLWEKSVAINYVNITFQIDSGASHTIVTDKLFSSKPLFVKSNIKL